MRPRMLLLAALLATLLIPMPGWCQGNSFPSRPGVVRGQIRLPDGHPAPIGIPVILMHREGDMVAETQTDVSGKFDFREVRPAIYRIKVRAHGYLEIESTDLDLNLQSMHYLNLDLKRDPSYKSPFATTLPGGAVSAESLAAPEGAQKDLAAGEELLSKGTDYPKAIELFQRALKAYPKYSEAYLMLGLAYRAQDNLDQSAAALKKCIEINATSLPAYTALGEVQNQQKDYPGAEKTLLKAVQLNPNSAAAQVELGRSLWAQQRWQDAEPHVTQALTVDPDNAAAHLLMGNINLRKRDGQAALQQFQAYLKLDPQGAMAPSVRDLVGKLEKALGQAPSQPQAKTP